jgi:hypothetical protein
MSQLEGDIDSFKLTWRVAEGEAISKLMHEYHRSYGYLEKLVLKHITREQLKDIIWFQRHKKFGDQIKPREIRTSFYDVWKTTHKKYDN